MVATKQDLICCVALALRLGPYWDGKHLALAGTIFILISF